MALKWLIIVERFAVAKAMARRGGVSERLPPPLAGFRWRRKRRRSCPAAAGSPAFGGGKTSNMNFVYILQSESEKYYVGSTSDVEKRLYYHHSGKNRSTKNKGPWKLIYIEAYEDKQSALKREKQIKSYKGGNAFKKLLNIN